MESNLIVQPEVTCTSAKDFIEIISPIGPYFRPFSLDEAWIFRGHGEANYELLPSLHRNGCLQRFIDFDLSDASGWRRGERDVLTKFFELADKRGLILPDDILPASES